MSFKNVVIAIVAALNSGILCAQIEEAPILVRTFAEIEKPVGLFSDGKFEPVQGETISLVGGTTTFDQQRYPFLEMRIQTAWPDQALKVRNLGWQGDTIFDQARPRFFYTKVGDSQPGSSPDTREKTIPGVIILNFGKMESLGGEGKLAAFLNGYKALLDELQKKTGRLVLIGPSPFFPTGPAAALTDSRNANLKKYVDGIAAMAAERKLLFVDVFSEMDSSSGNDLSTNGIHLTEKGHAEFAGIVARKLSFPSQENFDSETKAMKVLEQSIVRKDRLWQQYYHPTNWAFLFGDRQHVPASRDYIDTDQRWFVKEVDAIPPLIAETETDIHRYAKEALK